MKPEHLDPLLRSLPRDEASELFTPRLMARVRAASRPAGSSPGYRKLAPLGATLIVLLASLVGYSGWQDRREEAHIAEARLESLRLAQEIEELQRLTSEPEPVLYLGSTTHYDYFIDLEDLQESSAVAQPAAHRQAQPGI